jgi:hypothetical protein
MDNPKQPPKNPTPTPSGDGYLYDATLTQVDAVRGALVFSVGEATHRITYPNVGFFSAGAVGRLRLPAGTQAFAFHAYPDQRLRRAPELDQPQEGRWGWRIGERPLLILAGVIPGRAGKVIRRDTESLSLELPREFLEFCATRGITPERVLRGFIADLCTLMDFFVCPREDRYCSNGSDERRLASEYFKRTWGWVDEPEHRAAVRAARRQERKHD